METISDNYFKILGVTKISSNADIKKAFRQLIKKWHPDLYLNDLDRKIATKKSQELLEAYNLLRDYNSNQIQNEPEKANKAPNNNQNVKCDWQNITRLKVKSSNVFAIGFDDITNTLIVEFKNYKSIYLYFDVPFHIYEKFIHAESKGRFIGNLYRYKYLKVR